jgi:hypothetical protein
MNAYSAADARANTKTLSTERRLNAIVRDGRLAFSKSSRRHELAGEQVERNIWIDWLPPKPARKLMQHQAGGNGGGVDRAPRRATANLRF